MRMKKRAWHTALYTSLTGGDLPQSLCKYTWTIIINCMLWIGFITIITLMFYSFIGFTIAAIKFPSTALDPKSSRYEALKGLAIIGYVLYGILVIVFISWLVSKKKYLLVEYIKAYFKKACPRIEWVD